MLFWYYYLDQQQKCQNNFIKFMSKVYLGNLETRNTKYQGYIVDNTRQGVGILIDDSLLFCLSNWKNDQPSGYSFITYPNRQLFYGSLNNGRPSGICCYMPNLQYTIIGNFNEGICQKVAIKFNDQLLVYEGRVYENGQQEESKMKLQIINKTIESENKEVMWKQIEKILNCEIAIPFRNYQTFINAYLVNDISSELEIIRKIDEIFIGFKGPSLGIRIKNNLVQSLGFYSNQKILIMGKKYQIDQRNNILVHQGLFQQKTQIHTYQQERPLAATKTIQQYFKKGTFFNNVFTKVQFFQIIYSEFKLMNNYVAQQITHKFGQSILENAPSQEPNKIYSLKEIKDMIQKAATRKNNVLPPNTPYQILRNSRSRNSSRQNLRISTNRSNSRESPKRYVYLQQLPATNYPPNNPVISEFTLRNPLSDHRNLNTFRQQMTQRYEAPTNNYYSLKHPQTGFQQYKIQHDIALLQREIEMAKAKQVELLELKRQYRRAHFGRQVLYSDEEKRLLEDPKRNQYVNNNHRRMVKPFGYGYTKIERKHSNYSPLKQRYSPLKTKRNKIYENNNVYVVKENREPILEQISESKSPDAIKKRFTYISQY